MSKLFIDMPFAIGLFFSAMFIIVSALELHFFFRFSNLRPKVWQYVLLIIVYCVLYSHLSFAHEVLIFSAIGVLLRREAVISFIFAILTVTVMYISAGITTPILPLLSNYVPDILKPYLGITTTVLSVSIAFATYVYTAQTIAPSDKRLGNDGSEYYIAVILFPVLLILMISWYIVNKVYGNVVVIENMQIVWPKTDDITILIIQLIAYVSFISILFGYRKLVENFEIKTRFVLMERENAAQAEYLNEARERYRQTQSFRHDIKNHLSVMRGLLDRGDAARAAEYLDNLQISSRKISVYRTNNLALDVLLNEKLEMAAGRGIDIECFLKIPESESWRNRLNDIDLCVVLSNAIDNAVKACDTSAERGADECRNAALNSLQSELSVSCRLEKKYIRINSRLKGDFLMIDIENSNGKYEHGTGIGLANIEAVAQKYGGCINVEETTEVFRLSVLFKL